MDKNTPLNMLASRLYQSILDRDRTEFVNSLESLQGRLNQKIVIDAIGFAVCRDDIKSIEDIINVFPEFDINLKNSAGNTVIMLSVAYNSQECFEYLLDFGADLTIQNKAGDNALDMATIQKEACLQDNENTKKYGYSDKIIDCLTVLDSIKRIKTNGTSRSINKVRKNKINRGL